LVVRLFYLRGKKVMKMKKAVILVVAGVIKSGCAGANLNMMRARCADRIDLISIID